MSTHIHINGLDLETTGLLAPEHRIIECCISRYVWDGKVLDKIDNKTWRIDPRRPIDAKAEAVHKITANDLIGCPVFEDVADEIVRELNNAPICVGHNFMEFDGPFVAQELERVGVALPDFEPYDTMLEGRWATAMGNVPNLGALCFACGIDYDEDQAHAAEYDVHCMMQCYEYGLRRGVFALPGRFGEVFVDIAA